MIVIEDRWFDVDPWIERLEYNTLQEALDYLFRKNFVPETDNIVIEPADGNFNIGTFFVLEKAGVREWMFYKVRLRHKDISKVNWIKEGF